MRLRGMYCTTVEKERASKRESETEKEKRQQNTHIQSNPRDIPEPDRPISSCNPLSNVMYKGNQRQMHQTKAKKICTKNQKPSDPFTERCPRC